ncbi:branched-chain amino acid ABC transporter ATP-binding protein/permease [Desertimonas flava]|uniref:branched-chain amino acid ABC transporter ATP-binding protein/permease n=1 Tax=Desertimonas flava TaxID=2064846 RepID=UPI000E34C900|nr:branched-chain amino acid ABC transporter ATP-binding protein/permease [Desertimonas flava]
MEPVTSVTGGRRSWIAHAVLLGALLLGPRLFSEIVSGVSSVITWPLSQQLHIASNQYEVFNTSLLLTYLIAAIGLNLLTQSGLISMGHTAFFAIGAYGSSILTVTYGWSYWPALIVVTVGSALVGFVLGLPGTRLGLFTFAMVTLAYTLTTQKLALQWTSLTGGGTGFRRIKFPAGFDDLDSFYWVLVVVVVLAYVLAHNLLRSSFGRNSRAVETSPVAAQSMGIHVQRVKVRSFAVSSAFAAAAGALYAPLIGFIAPDTFHFDLAVLFLLMVIFGGAGTLAGPLIGAVVLFRVPIEVERVSSSPGPATLLVYGGALLLLVWISPGGVVVGVHALRSWVSARLRRIGSPDPRLSDTPAVAADRHDAEADAHRRQALQRFGDALDDLTDHAAETIFVAQDVHVNLGGVQALAGLNLEVRAGEIHALLGPNGSGKTTFLNTVSGYVTPDRGSITFLGRSLLDRPAHGRATAGLTRTFQTPFVFGTMSTAENVLAALDQDRTTGLIRQALRMPAARREERRLYDEAVSILTAVGLEHRVTDPAGALTPGERRLLELARVIALRPRFILMDEPAAGLTGPEVDHLEAMIAVLRSRGIATLLVEHHVDMVLRLADVVTVIDFGRVIAHGLPESIGADPAVRRAYLGDSHAHDDVADPDKAESQVGTLEAAPQP